MADQQHVAGARPPLGWRASEIPASKGLIAKQGVGAARQAAPPRPVLSKKRK